MNLWKLFEKLKKKVQNYAKRWKIKTKRKITQKCVKSRQKVLNYAKKCKITPKGVKLHQKD